MVNLILQYLYKHFNPSYYYVCTSVGHDFDYIRVIVIYREKLTAFCNQVIRSWLLFAQLPSSYTLFCADFRMLRCGRAVIGVVFLVVTSVVRILLLDLFFFFCKFRPSCFQVSFWSPLSVSVFLVLLIISVKFTYSINRKLYFISSFVQLTKLCVKVFSGL